MPQQDLDMEVRDKSEGGQKGKGKKKEKGKEKTSFHLESNSEKFPIPSFCYK